MNRIVGRDFFAMSPAQCLGDVSTQRCLDEVGGDFGDVTRATERGEKKVLHNGSKGKIGSGLR